MSWSTSSRERAKLGRLDSEPPLLLREWPPETGRRKKGRAGAQIQATGGEKRQRRCDNKQREQSEEGQEREKREKERAQFIYLQLCKQTLMM